MRKEVASLKAKEQEQQSSIKKKSQGIEAPEIVIDDEFLLPYNAGFDDVIKKKAELIDSQKETNNKVMDDLVLKLGYMDYRDALACNKYILEAKRSGDYHQIARGRILQSALSRLSRTKRAQLDRDAH